MKENRPILPPKLVAMATALERLKKESRIPNLRSNAYNIENMVKIGPVDPQIIYLKGFVFKLEIISTYCVELEYLRPESPPSESLYKDGQSNRRVGVF